MSAEYYTVLKWISSVKRIKKTLIMNLWVS